MLAWSLMQQQKSVLIISNDKPSASHIAAGLINPVTGKRLVKSDATSDYIDTVNTLYGSLEKFFEKKFLHHVSMLRILKSSDGKAAWKKRTNDPDYQAYLGPLNENPHLDNYNTPFGSFTQQHTGWLDIPELLNSLKRFFIENNSYLCAQPKYDEIQFQPDSIKYKSHTARQLIFCEGYHAQKNPLFSWLPFKPAKGEILTCKSQEKLSSKIINAGQWILPVSETVFRSGATYQWNELNEQPDINARNTLQAGLEQIFIQSPEYELIDHKAGVRPCTADSQPFTGFHPDIQSAGIFNGFGSRGSLTIPYYAKQMTLLITKQKPLPAHADIRRHQKKYNEHITNTTRT